MADEVRCRSRIRPADVMVHTGNVIFAGISLNVHHIEKDFCQICRGSWGLCYAYMLCYIPILREETKIMLWLYAQKIYFELIKFFDFLYCHNTKFNWNSSW
jgi:hypothetical protein